jgi:hypothetical protein
MSQQEELEIVRRLEARRPKCACRIGEMGASSNVGARKETYAVPDPQNPSQTSPLCKTTGRCRSMDLFYKVLSVLAWQVGAAALASL